MRRPTLLMSLIGAVFLGALLSRSAWYYRATFSPDASTVLWMALDAVRHSSLPDHGLVSSFHVFQPPGLVWLTLPFVALGGGRPEFVIVGFGLLNAAATALLVATIARSWGLFHAAALGAFLIVGPDVFYSAWIWHPSLYTAALALMLTAGIRLRAGSSWWALPLVSVPGLYALIHYSGFVLYAPALVLVVLARPPAKRLLLPVLSGAILVACAWGPFLVFEARRDWHDLRVLADASDDTGGLSGKIEDRAEAFRFALSHLGESLHGAVHLTYVIWALVSVAVVIALARRGWREPAFVLPFAMLASGLAAQIAVDQGERADVLMLWDVPLYALSAWAIVQVVDLARLTIGQRRVAPIVGLGLITLVVAVGSLDQANSVRAVSFDDRLSAKWKAARAGGPVYYEAGIYPERSSNRFYLPCDPPYDWGSEIWYLREVLEQGAGLADAVRAGAFRARAESPCARYPRGSGRRSTTES